MNSTFSILLSMFKNEIRQYILNRNQIQYNTGISEPPLLLGQKITKSEIQKLLSFQMMNPYEKQVVEEMLMSMVNPAYEQNKQLIKKIPGVMPYTENSEQTVTNVIPFVQNEVNPVEFKDAA